MGDRRGPRIDEAQARRLWERAAEIQAEAARREEEASRELPAHEGEGRLLRGETDEERGYSLAHVKQAGMEVGIQEEFLDLALGEETILEMEGGSGEGVFDGVVSRFLGDDRRAMEVRRVFAFPARSVWLSLEDALASDPNNFDLLDTKGGDPAEGGVAIFEAPYNPKNDGSLRYWSVAADTKRYLVRVTPGEGEEECEVLIRIPMRRSRRLGGGAGVGFLTGLGILGGWGGLGIAGLVAGTGGMATLPLSLLLAGGALGGAVGAGSLTRVGWRAVYRWGLRGLDRSLQRLLTHIERELQRGASLQ